MAHAIRRRVLPLEFAHILTADEGRLRDHLAERCVELLLVCKVLGMEVDEWNAHGGPLRES